MNRITRPSLSLISLRTALSRSSNSPRNLEPAMSAPRSSVMTRLSLSVSGTSPRTIRWARPSAMAVLPTPGSPISTGLFLVRRLRTWMTRRISSSRPMTGSSLPGAGLCGQVAAVLLQRLVGALGVGAGDALAAADRLEGAQDGLAAGAVLLEELLGLAADLGHAQEQVLRRGVLVAQPARLLLGAVDDALGARIQAELAALDAGAPGQGGRDLAAERGEIHAEAPERLGGDAVVGVDEGGEQVLRVEHGALHPLGELLGGDDGLLGLLGEAVELHGSGSRGSVGRRGSVRWIGDRAGRRGPGTLFAASLAPSLSVAGSTTRTFT